MKSKVLSPWWLMLPALLFTASCVTFGYNLQVGDTWSRGFDAVTVPLLTMAYGTLLYGVTKSLQQYYQSIIKAKDFEIYLLQEAALND